MPSKSRVSRASWVVLALMAPTVAAPFVAVCHCSAQDDGRCAGAPVGDAVVGMIREATPLLRQASCQQAPIARTELTTQLSDVDRLRMLDDRRLPQTASQRASLLASVVGSGGDDEGAGIDMAETLSNVLTVGVVSWQMVSDVSLHDRAMLTDATAWELLFADALAHAIAQGVAYSIREDGEQVCQDGDHECEAAALRPSGRTAMAFTSASLMCLHRQMAGNVDLGECAGAMALAAGVGAMRLFTEEHDATDVLLGAGIGLVAGYLVPLGTLYVFGGRTPQTRMDGHEHHDADGDEDPHAETEDIPRGDWGIRATIAPSFSSNRGIGLRLAGTF